MLFFFCFLLNLFLLQFQVEVRNDVNGLIKKKIKEYLEPFKMITKEMMDNTIKHAFSKHNSRNTTVLFQYIDGKLSWDSTRFHTPHLWDQQRLKFINDTIQSLIAYRHFDRDFELVYNPHDCPVRNLFRNKDLLLAPIFGNLRCPQAHAAIIPFPQWYYRRDGSFSNMTWYSNDDWYKTWAKRRPVTIYRGFYRSSCLTPQLHFINLNDANPLGCGRAALLKFKDEVLDVALFSEDPLFQFTTKKGQISLEDQSKMFKYVIYAEGNCGWADRLKILLTSGMLIFMQDTPCHEWYHSLLQPWKHYVPVANDWSNLLERIQWARQNDNLVLQIVRNAFNMGNQLMNPDVWQNYLYELLYEYSQRLNYQITKRAFI